MEDLASELSFGEWEELEKGQTQRDIWNRGRGISKGSELESKQCI